MEGEWESVMELLKKYLKPLLKEMSISFLMKDRWGALAVLLLPYLLAYVIDTIVPTKDIQRIVVYGLIMIAVSIAAGFLTLRPIGLPRA